MPHVMILSCHTFSHLYWCFLTLKFPISITQSLPPRERCQWRVVTWVTMVDHNPPPPSPPLCLAWWCPSPSTPGSPTTCWAWTGGLTGSTSARCVRRYVHPECDHLYFSNILSWVTFSWWPESPPPRPPRYLNINPRRLSWPCQPLWPSLNYLFPGVCLQGRPTAPHTDSPQRTKTLQVRKLW